MLKVIGAGFGRTGTTSTKLALEQLGFGRCYHFTELLRAGHAKSWLQIANGTRPDWDTLFAGFQSTTDWPGAAFYRELAEAYPDAKVILTVRDSDDWYLSVTTTIYRLRASLPAWLPGLGMVVRLADRLIWEGEFSGRIEDRAYAIAKYKEHNARVCSELHKERLLVFDVRDGWAPLCHFLQVPVPSDVPFPRANDARSVRRLIGAINVVKVLALLLVAGAVVYGLQAFSRQAL